MTQAPLSQQQPDISPQTSAQTSAQAEMPSLSTSPHHSVCILAVEDDPLSMTFLEAQIAQLGHRIMTARNGEEAITMLKAHKGVIDVVLMDREMPVMDGLTAIRRMKSSPDLRSVPVVMVTGADTPEDMRKGLEAGVFYYLTKPVQETMLKSVLSAAIREAAQARTLAEELGKHRSGFHLIDTCKFNFRTLTEAENLAVFMANCFPDPARVLTGLGELLINAIEHGNLGVGYDRKTAVLEADTWRNDVDAAQQSDAHSDKFATATITKKRDGIYVVIEDQGDGFDWKKYMHIDPARAADSHGRGIAKANTISFDKLAFNDKGNKAVAFVSFGKKLDW